MRASPLPGNPRLTNELRVSLFSFCPPFLPSVLPSPLVLLQFQSICLYSQPKAGHYRSMLLAAGDCQVCLIQLFFFSLTLFPFLFAESQSLSVLFSRSSSSSSCSLFLSAAARGTNRRPAELNVAIAESQMALAEGSRERGIDAIEMRSDEAAA